VSTGSTTTAGVPGDWLEVGRPSGDPPRRGQILEVLGQAGHTHYRVRWDEEHESLFYPTEGVTILPHRGHVRS
jgi:Domain of unknown function (DUF1918)